MAMDFMLSGEDSDKEIDYMLLSLGIDAGSVFTGDFLLNDINENEAMRVIIAEIN
jgi:hypothetical protein